MELVSLNIIWPWIYDQECGNEVDKKKLWNIIIMTANVSKGWSWCHGLGVNLIQRVDTWTPKNGLLAIVN